MVLLLSKAILRFLLLLLLVLLLLFPTAPCTAESLVFCADLVIQSEPIRNLACVLKRCSDSNTIRDCLLTAGHQRTCQNVPLTASIKQLWNDACRDHYDRTYIPQRGDTAMATRTSTPFPGFSVQTTLLNGCQRRYDKHGWPVYKFCLIGDRRTYTGPAPIVWLVHKLTGTGTTRDDSYTLSDTTAQSRISIVELQRNACYAFEFHVQFQTKVYFPDVLLKLLPASKRTVEERGTKAIRKVLERDIRGALKALCELVQQEEQAHIASE